MKIAVTGAAGNVGPFVVAELLDHGHDVVAVDLREPASNGAAFRRADLEDLKRRRLRGYEGDRRHLEAIAEATRRAGWRPS